MTTIAYKDGVIAYDSLMTHNEIVVDDDYNKLTKRNGVIYVLCGTVTENDTLIAGYEGRKHEAKEFVAGVIYDRGALYFAGVGDNGFWKMPVNLRKTVALGSGKEFAFGAMDMGAGAAQAVKVAAKRDIYTGGKIRTYYVTRLCDQGS